MHLVDDFTLLREIILISIYFLSAVQVIAIKRKTETGRKEKKGTKKEKEGMHNILAKHAFRENSN